MKLFKAIPIEFRLSHEADGDVVADADAVRRGEVVHTEAVAAFLQSLKRASTCGRVAWTKKKGREERFGDDAVVSGLAYLLVTQGDVTFQTFAFYKGLGLEDAGVGHTEHKPLQRFYSCFLTGILYRHPTFIC